MQETRASRDVRDTWETEDSRELWDMREIRDTRETRKSLKTRESRESGGDLGVKRDQGVMEWQRHKDHTNFDISTLCNRDTKGDTRGTVDYESGLVHYMHPIVQYICILGVVLKSSVLSTKSLLWRKVCLPYVLSPSLANVPTSH